MDYDTKTVKTEWKYDPISRDGSRPPRTPPTRGTPAFLGPLFTGTL